MNIPLIKPDLPKLDELRESFEEILGNGRITNFGKYVRQFETETGEHLGAQTVAVSSGTAGLVFSMHGLGVKPGDNVILPSFTFMATAQAVLCNGATPVFAEVEEDLTLSPADLEQLLDTTPNVGAVIAVHMYGLPAHAEELQQVVDAASKKSGRKIPLIFDAAHAFGSSIKGRKVGTFGDAEVFSLSVTKVLVTVEGGLVATQNAELVEKIRAMRNYGVKSNYNAHYLGLNGKMSEFHAIVGLHNLRRFNQLMETRQCIGRAYAEKVHKRTPFKVTAWPKDVVHSLKDFTIMLSPEMQARRPEIIQHLADNGVESRAYFYPPVHEQEFFQRFTTRPLPKTETLSRRVITLPFYTTMTEPEMDYVVDQLAEAGRRVA